LPSKPDVLIVARSGRQLAQAARAAGYQPVVIDLFGDVDTAAICAANVVLTPGKRFIFDADELLAALSELRSTVGTIPLVWGSGWEVQAHLLAAIAPLWPLQGCPIAALFAANDPAALAAVLGAVDITLPTLAYGAIPPHGSWLLKRRGSVGGYGVVEPGKRRHTGQCEYLQSVVTGVSLSAAFIAGAGWVELLGVCEAINLQSDRRYPYRFSAAVAAPRRFAALKARLSTLVATLGNALALRGLCGVDFMVDDDGDLVFIELNARPSATFDLVAAPGPAFAAHMAAVAGGGRPSLESLSTVRAMAVCYANHPIVVPKTLNWPVWVSDRPHPNAQLHTGAPICSIAATAQSTAGARELLDQRYHALMRLLD